MLLNTIITAAIMAAAYHLPTGDEALAVVIAALVTRFYFMMTCLMIGIAQAYMNSNLNIFRAVVSYAAQIIGVLFVYIGPYSTLAVVSLPWLIIAGCSLLISVLVTLGVIEFHKK